MASTYNIYKGFFLPFQHWKISKLSPTYSSHFQLFGCYQFYIYYKIATIKSHVHLLLKKTVILDFERLIGSFCSFLCSGLEATNVIWKGNQMHYAFLVFSAIVKHLEVCSLSPSNIFGLFLHWFLNIFKHTLKHT